MPEVDELQREIQNLRKELRGEGKPWYAKSPFKEILTHAAAVTTAVGIGLVVHKWTGEPITIEAKNAPAESAAAQAVYVVDLADRDAQSSAPAAWVPPEAEAVALAPVPAEVPKLTAPRPKPRATMILPPMGELAGAPAAAAPAAPVATTAAAKRPVQTTAVRTGD
jgi:hypothetical protein